MKMLYQFQCEFTHTPVHYVCTNVFPVKFIYDTNKKYTKRKYHRDSKQTFLHHKFKMHPELVPIAEDLPIKLICHMVEFTVLEMNKSRVAIF